MGEIADPPFAIDNAAGRGPLLIVCDHASNRIPPAYGDLGLTPEARADHIAWDPGALSVSRHLSRIVDAPLFRGTVSRLVADVNREADSPTLIPAVSETTPIPGNADVGADERSARLAAVHVPYHAALATFVEEALARRAGAPPPAVVAIHSFTPVYMGTPRDFDAGVLFEGANRFGQRVLDALAAVPGIAVRANAPYSGEGEVYYTLRRHAAARGLPNVMIEIRNDLLHTEAEAEAWAMRLAAAIRAARPADD
ncbi:N-formylglutamate amidohydrolase [Methylobrevis pamukkalensis]|uniref:N-formylglutamate amidohydrolase n=1 Tax=Methylobrevis pamukkalensis TaxID=1439726 RepID=A0A1E3H265_9HYPH|nr:N-formylglutamate amidohydrolase [Methylobrevis pamukkalensis]ODN69631.1 N-formylglutamate amidohydrolase [Methylobrevis pamukkalensis]